MACLVLEKGGILPYINLGPVHFYLRDFGASLILMLAIRRMAFAGTGLLVFMLSIGIAFTGVILSRNLQFPFLIPLGYIVALGLLIYHSRVNPSSLLSGRIAIFFIFLVLSGAFLNGILLNGTFKAGVAFRSAFYLLSFLLYYGVAYRSNEVSNLLGYANIALMTALAMWVIRHMGFVDITSAGFDTVFGTRYIDAEEAAFAGFACLSYLAIIYNGRKGFWQLPIINKSLVFASFALSLCIVVAARHRTVWACFIISVLVLLLFHYGRIAYLVRLIFLAGIIGILLTSGFIKTDNRLVLAVKEAVDISGGNTFSWRVETWKQLVVAAGKANPVSGSGYGRDMAVSRFIAIGNINETDTSAHNLIIQIFGDAGVVGVLAVIILYVLPILRSLRKIKIIGRGDTSFICAITAFWIVYSIPYQNTILTGISLAWGITGFITLYSKKEIKAIA